MTFKEWFEKYKIQMENLHFDIEDLEAAFEAGKKEGLDEAAQDAAGEDL